MQLFPHREGSTYDTVASQGEKNKKSNDNRKSKVSPVKAHDVGHEKTKASWP